MIDLLLMHGTIVTMDQERKIIDDGAVAVDKGQIVDIGPSSELRERYQAARVLDCTGQIVTPGLIDAHSHAGTALLGRHYSDTLTLWPLAARRVGDLYSDDESWQMDGMLKGLQHLYAGVTTSLSVVGAEPRSDHPAPACHLARGIAATGARSVIAAGPSGPWPRRYGYWDHGNYHQHEASLDSMLDSCEAILQSTHGSFDGRIRAFVAPAVIVPSLHTEQGRVAPEKAARLSGDDRRQASLVRALARKYHTMITTSAWGYGVRLAAQDDEALLGPDVLLSHGTGLTFEEVNIIKRTGTKLVQTGDVGFARLPVPELLQAGVNVAIATDGGGPRTHFDLLQALRRALILEYMHFDDRCYLPAGKALEMITIDAARALGWDDEIGSLEPGKRADIAIFDWQQAHLTPWFMPVHRLVHAAVGADVSTVIVDGKIVTEKRKSTMVDEAALYQAASDKSAWLIEVAGLSGGRHSVCWGKAYFTISPDDPALDLAQQKGGDAQ